MMVKFRCKRSGNTVSFVYPHDIESMRNDEGYEEVKEATKAQVIEPEVKKQRGRPKSK